MKWKQRLETEEISNDIAFNKKVKREKERERKSKATPKEKMNTAIAKLELTK